MRRAYLLAFSRGLNATRGLGLGHNIGRPAVSPTPVHSIQRIEGDRHDLGSLSHYRLQGALDRLWRLDDESRSCRGSRHGAMQEIAAAIQEGRPPSSASSTIAIVGVVIFAILAYLLGIPQAIGFAIGAVLSGVTRAISA